MKNPVLLPVTYYLIFTICYLFPFLSSCRTPGQIYISPVSMERERVPERIPFDRYSPSWLPFAEDEFHGLYFTSARLSDPDLEIWAIKADLANPSVKIEVSIPIDNSGERGIFQSIRVSSFVRDSGLFAGINTVPFSFVPQTEGEKMYSVGVVISNGVLYSPPVLIYDALIFYNRNFQTGGRRAAILSQREIGKDGSVELHEIENAVGGFRIILELGALPERLVLAAADTERPPPSRHPRSAAGLCREGRFLYLLVVDGRRQASIGATEMELAWILWRMGAYEGLNFDGGGSTALALRYPDGRVRVVNTPVNGGIPGWERPVAASLGLGLAENGQISR